MRTLLAWLLTTVALTAIDFVWLGVVAREHYRRGLGHLLADDVNRSAAAVLYLVLTAGAFVFAVLPALERGSASHALGMGALFGFFAYAIYDLTNLATLRDWPVPLALVDIVWGTLLTGTASWIGYHITRVLGAASA